MTDSALPVVMVQSSWGSPVEIERRRRIFVTLWAYAYEVKNISIVDDCRFDLESALIDVSMDTGHPVLDAFFREHFSPETGMWVHQHPEIDKITAFGKRMGHW